MWSSAALPALARGPQHVDERRSAGRRSLRRLGRLADDGEDRALDRLEHRLVGAGRGRRQRLGDPVPRRRRRVPFSVDVRPRRIWLRITPLLPRAPISEPWLIASHVGVELGGRRLHLGDHGVERAGHVGAGVAVGHRVHVEPVDGRRRAPARCRDTW